MAKKPNVAPLLVKDYASPDPDRVDIYPLPETTRRWIQAGKKPVRAIRPPPPPAPPPPPEWARQASEPPPRKK